MPNEFTEECFPHLKRYSPLHHRESASHSLEHRAERKVAASWKGECGVTSDSVGGAQGRLTPAAVANLM